MKLIIGFILLLATSVMAQTNIIFANLAAVPKIKTTCDASLNYFFVATASFKASGIQPKNKWFYPTTNLLSISCTNSDAVVFYTSRFGSPNHCAKGSETWTDPNWTINTYQFVVYWSNNVPPPTNMMIPLTIVNFRTNAP